jgi:C1A family cysteine protease
MAAYVGAHGPLSIIVDASEWQTYTSGILSTCGTSVDHAVQVVGVDTYNGWWKVRNSWNTTWGEAGYIYLAYGADTCAITTDANYCDAADYA